LGAGDWPMAGNAIPASNKTKHQRLMTRIMRTRPAPGQAGVSCDLTAAGPPYAILPAA
jgi:hypothetical protein